MSEGYAIPPYESSSADQANVTVSTAAVTLVKSKPGIGKRLLVPWLIIVNRSATFTTVQVKSGSTVIAYIPAPASSGAFIPLPTPLKLDDNADLNINTEDAVVSVSVTCGFVVAPAAGSGV